MKRIALIISFIAFFSLGCIAQGNTVRYGLKLGPSLDWASVGSTATKNDGMRVGFNVGLIYDHYFSDHIALSSGVNINFLRMKYTFTDRRYVEDFLEQTVVSVSRRLNATNIEIPLKAKVSFDVFDLFKAYVEAGGGLGFNIKDMGKDGYKYYWVSYESPNYDDCTSQYRLVQLSMVFGVGAEYEINKNLGAFLQVTFNHAFSNAFVRSLEKQTGSILRNNFIGIEAGIMF